MTVDPPIIKAFTDAARETLGTMALLEMEVAEVQTANELDSSLHDTIHGAVRRLDEPLARRRLIEARRFAERVRGAGRASRSQIRET